MKRYFYLITLLLPNLAHAYGSLLVDSSSGASLSWDNSSSIVLSLEAGDCSIFTNSEMVNKIDEDSQAWTDLEDVDLTVRALSGEIEAVDESNYQTMLDDATNVDKNPVTFDEGGDIVASLFGEENRYAVLGFAQAIDSSGLEITRGNFLINCSCFEGSGDNCTYDCTAADGSITTCTYTAELSSVDAVIIHELGHMLNLDHTQVNGDLVDSTNAADQEAIPTMYPIAVFPEEQAVPQQDDISGLGVLYPSATFATTHCLVTGTLLDQGGDPLRCADVQAHSTDPADSVAFVSGNNAPAEDNNGDSDTADSGECNSGCGDFEMYLLPDRDYTITVEPINADFVDGSGIGPCYTGQLTTIIEEDIATVSAASCTAGATVALGELTTTSTGGVSDGTTGTTTSGAHGGGIQRVFGCSLDERESSRLRTVVIKNILPAIAICLALLIFKRKYL